MKKVISISFLFAFVIYFVQGQNSAEKWEAWSARLAEKAERLAEQFSHEVEVSAEELAVLAEDLAADVEERFDNGDFEVQVKGWPDRVFKHTDESTGYLGIHSEHLSKKKAERLGFKNRYGSYVSKVVKNSAAEKAGLQPFDYIYGVEDQRTSDNQDLSDILDDYEPGEEVTLHFIRKGEKKNSEGRAGRL